MDAFNEDHQTSHLEVQRFMSDLPQQKTAGQAIFEASVVYEIRDESARFDMTVYITTETNDIPIRLVNPTIDARKYPTQVLIEWADYSYHPYKCLKLEGCHPLHGDYVISITPKTWR
jgi:hypothetical protein